jgi:hypothetical protein
MPNIPTEESLGFTPPDPGGDRRVIIPNAGAVGEAYATLGQQGERTGLAVIDKAQQQQQGDVDLQTAAASSSLLRSQLELDQKYADDTDYGTLPQRYQADLQKAKGTALGAITDPRARQKFSIAADDVILKSVYDMKGTAQGKQRDQTAGFTATLLDGNTTAATNTKDSAAQGALLDASLAAIDGAQKQGVYSAEQAAQLKIKYKSEFAKAVLGSMDTASLVRALGGDPDQPTKPAAGDIAARVRLIESSGNYEAKGGGAYQVHNGPVNENSLPAEQDAFFASEFPKRGADLSAKLGRPIDPGENYLAWQQGTAGATKLLQNPAAKASDLVGLAAVRDNLPDNLKAQAATISAGQFAQVWETRYDQAGGDSAPAVAQASGTPSEMAMLLPADERLNLLGAAQRQLQADQNAADATQQKQLAALQSATEADLAVKLERGQAGYVELNTAMESGTVSNDFWKNQTIALDKKTLQDATDAQLIAKARAAGAGGMLLDPRNADDRKGLNMLFDQTAATWQSLPPDQLINNSVAFAVQKAIVPDKLQALIRGGLRSGDATPAILAADTLQKLRNANPELLNDFNQQDIRLGNLISTYTSDGVPPAKAVELANASMNVSDVDRKARDADYDAQRGKDATEQSKSDEGWLAKQIDGPASWYQFWRRDPQIGAQAKAEFNNLAQLEFERTGELEASRKTALDYMNRVWAVTQVGASENLPWNIKDLRDDIATSGQPRLMKFAPEKFYGVPGLTADENASWMNEQLLADVSNVEGSKQPALPPNRDQLLRDELAAQRTEGFSDFELLARLGARGRQLPEFSPTLPVHMPHTDADEANTEHPVTLDRLMVTPDPTRTDAQGRPVYQISLRGSDGLLYAVTGNDGKPVMWHPDWDTSAEKARRAAELNKVVDEARLDRKRLLAVQGHAASAQWDAGRGPALLGK